MFDKKKIASVRDVCQVRYDPKKVREVLCDKEVIQGTSNPVLEQRRVLNINLAKNKVKQVTVIMMNPSRADSDQSDPTVDRVINFFDSQPVKIHSVNTGNESEANDIGSINVCNLFPVYNPESPLLGETIKQIVSQTSYEQLRHLIECNNRLIERAITDSSYVVLAWGDCPSNCDEILYCFQMNAIMSLLFGQNKELCVFEIDNRKQRRKTYLTRKRNPVHPINGPIERMIKISVNYWYKGIIIE